MKNPSLNILKSLAIILVVMAHSCSPTYVSRLAYMLCVSLFFLASGYCFDTRYLTDEATYVKRRFKRLYIPFVKWSIFFLLLNHLWFYIGFLSEHYGNAAGGVTHPLTLHQGLQALWSIVFSMSGYDQFLAGAFWFFRALLVSSIAFLVGMKLLQTLRWFKDQHTRSALALAAIALIMALWQTSDGLKWTGLAQGGYRELMGTFFLAAGFAYRRFEDWLERPATEAPRFAAPEAASKQILLAVRCGNTLSKTAEAATRWLSAQPLVSMLLTASIITLLVIFPHPTMGVKARSLADVCWLAISGVAGFSLFYNLSRMFHKIVPARPVLDYIGTNTLYIFIWHIFVFKFVSMIKVGVYDLPWAMVGSHPVVHAGKGEWFWILYTLAGTAIPLAGIWLYRYCRTHYDTDFYLHSLKTALRYTARAITFAARNIAKATIFCSKKLWVVLGWIIFKMWDEIYGFCLTFIETIKASTDVGKDDENDDENEDEDEEDENEEDENEDENETPKES